MSDKPDSLSFYSSVKENNDIDLGKIFRFLLMQSKLILLIVFSAFLISYINYSFTTKKYMLQSLLQYESFNQNILDPSKSIMMGSSRPSDMLSLAELYASRTNYLKVIKDLKLNIDILELDDDDEFIDIEIISDEKNSSSRHELKFSFSDKGYSLLDKKFNTIEFSEFGDQIYFDDLTISIKSANIKEYRPIDIHYISPETMYSSLKNGINVDTNQPRNSWFTSQGLITVSYVTDDIDLGKKILDYSNSVFLNQRIYDETEKSRKAIDFIDLSINSIESDVEYKKIKLKEFREKNKSIDVSLEIEAIIKKIQFLDESINSIDIEINKAKELYTTNNPIYLNLINKKKLIQAQKEEVLYEIEMMPKEQQEYIDLFNDVEVSQSLFKELESRRLSFSIMEASTIGDIRVVDEAYVVSLVSPNLSFVFISTFLSFIFASLIAIIRGFNFLPISNPAEIFDNNIHLPIIGVIPKINDMSNVDQDIRFNSSIESLIVNIKSIQDKQDDKKIITITSPSPVNGKSTISMKLSEGFAKIDKKVLLVDNDLKRGKIASHYNIKSISKEIFNSIDESTINEFKVNDNFYVIPKITGLTNSFQFLYSYSYKEKIQFFKEHFDYVIFDTGPILSVSDSSILIEQSDINILIVRHGFNRMNEIKQSIDNFGQIRAGIDGIIYNAYEKPNSYYGYYGVYGNYSYQYYAEKYLYDTYDYEKKV